jgi:hypothetical protein
MGALSVDLSNEGRSGMSASKKRPEQKLRVEKRPLEEQPDDLPVSDEEAEDIKGGFAPPYVPVMPSKSLKDQVTRPDLSGGINQQGPSRGG